MHAETDAGTDAQAMKESDSKIMEHYPKMVQERIGIYIFRERDLFEKNSYSLSVCKKNNNRVRRH